LRRFFTGRPVWQELKCRPATECRCRRVRCSRSPHRGTRPTPIPNPRRTCDGARRAAGGAGAAHRVPTRTRHHLPRRLPLHARHHRRCRDRARRGGDERRNGGRGIPGSYPRFLSHMVFYDVASNTRQGIELATPVRGTSAQLSRVVRELVLVLVLEYSANGRCNRRPPLMVPAPGRRRR